MTNFDTVWSELQERLKDDYVDVDGIHPAQCYDIAKMIASALRSDGRNPEIFAVRGHDIVEDGWVRSSELLVPIPYEGRVTWSTHVICVEDDVVIDPIPSTPEPLATYTERAFGIRSLVPYSIHFRL